VLLSHSITAAPQKKKHADKKEDKKQVKKEDPQPEKKSADKKDPAADKKEAEVRNAGVCNCVWMKIQAQDTIANDAYITYIFTVKNRCKEPIWINSSKFGFVVNNFNGSRARVIRDLLFVKRSTYPPFVSIKPGSDFEFKFADNPFDEYQLKRGNRYWFRFTYNNTTLRHSSGKGLNYLCRKEMQRLVYIR